MPNRKTQNKETKESKRVYSKKKSAENFDEEPVLKDEHEIEEMLEEEMHGELNEEDNEDFIHEVEEFEKEHSKVKMISIYDKIGRPKFIQLKKLDPKSIKEQLKKLILILDKYNIIVHSHNEYSDREKYRFITEEIFKEVIEVDTKHHVTFVYEDYHPEMDEDEDEETYG